MTCKEPKAHPLREESFDMTCREPNAHLHHVLEHQQTMQQLAESISGGRGAASLSVPTRLMSTSSYTSVFAAPTSALVESKYAPGDLVFARYVADQQWYRGLIVSVEKEQAASK